MLQLRLDFIFAFLVQHVQDLLLKLENRFFLFVADLLKGRHFVELFGFVLLGLHGLAHAVRNARLVQCLISQNCHFHFVAHPHEQKPSFSTVDCGLPNQLVKSLCVQIFSDGTNTSFACLSFLQLFIKFLLQLHDIKSSSRDGTHVLQPQLAVFGVLIWR